MTVAKNLLILESACPAIPFLIRQAKLSSGIMISASHNPPEYNGINFLIIMVKKLVRSLKIKFRN